MTNEDANKTFKMLYKKCESNKEDLVNLMILAKWMAEMRDDLSAARGILAAVKHKIETGNPKEYLGGVILFLTGSVDI